MKNKRPLMLLLLACCLAQPVFSAKVFGVPDCGEWLSKTREPDRAWLLGYISGLSTTNRLGGDPLAKVNSAQQIFVWVDNYCQKNPLKDVADGAQALFFELAGK